MTRFHGFTDAELKVIDNALSFASSEGELTWEETKELGYELSGEQVRREGWKPSIPSSYRGNERKER